MLADQLEILIFTYNRGPSLERALSAFDVEPIRRCKITVLDNHSTDSTSDVCQRLAQRLPNFVHVRHPKNIGGLANYLRAVELAKAEYTWIICDDDQFDFSNAADLFAEIESSRSDVLSAGVHGHSITPGARGNLRDFSLREPVFFGHSFVPSMIFRTALFDPDCIRAGYDNIDTMFPHFPFMIKLAEADRSIYVSREKIISKSTNLGYSGFRFMAGWLKSCRRFSDQELRAKVISEVFGGSMFFKTLIFSALMERKFRPQKYRAEFADLRAEAARSHRLIWLKLLLSAPIVLGPDFIHTHLWKRFAAHRQKQGLPLPNFDESR